MAFHSGISYKYNILSYLNNEYSRLLIVSMDTLKPLSKYSLLSDSITVEPLLRGSNCIILIGRDKFGDLVLSFVERYLIQCPFLGGSSLRGSTVYA